MSFTSHYMLIIYRFLVCYRKHNSRHKVGITWHADLFKTYVRFIYEACSLFNMTYAYLSSYKNIISSFVREKNRLNIKTVRGLPWSDLRDETRTRTQVTTKHDRTSRLIDKNKNATQNQQHTDPNMLWNYNPNRDAILTELDSFTSPKSANSRTIIQQRIETKTWSLTGHKPEHELSLRPLVSLHRKWNLFRIFIWKCYCVRNIGCLGFVSLLFSFRTRVRLYVNVMWMIFFKLCG